jgi:hypothetical protein
MAMVTADEYPQQTEQLPARLAEAFQSLRKGNFHGMLWLAMDRQYFGLFFLSRASCCQFAAKMIDCRIFILTANG